MKHILHSGTRVKLWNYINSLNYDKSYLVTIKEYSKRSLPANNLQHVFYREIANYFGLEVKEIEQDCKIDFGLPIILADEEAGAPLRYMLDKCGFDSMNKYQQRKVINCISITSIMNTKQHQEYIEKMQVYWSKKGVYLESHKN